MLTAMSALQVRRTFEELSLPEFLRIWMSVTGQVPSVMLGSRAEMIDILIEGSGLAPLQDGEPVLEGPRGPGSRDPTCVRATGPQP